MYDFTENHHHHQYITHFSINGPKYQKKIDDSYDDMKNGEYLLIFNCFVESNVCSYWFFGIRLKCGQSFPIPHFEQWWVESFHTKLMNKEMNDEINQWFIDDWEISNEVERLEKNLQNWRIWWKELVEWRNSPNCWKWRYILMLCFKIRNSSGIEICTTIEEKSNNILVTLIACEMKWRCVMSQK